jgi:KDO2-lipid IV(A) lauroyltransferase
MKKNTSTSVVLAVFSAIPRKVRRKIFIALFLLFYHVSPRRRLIAIHNLKRAFPEKGMNEIIDIAKGVYRNMAIVAADFFDIPMLTPDNFRDLIEVEGLEHCRKALEKNKGVLMFGSHFGNWELGAIALSLAVKPSVVIYRPLDNPLLENLVTWVRSCTGNIPLAKDLAMRSMLRHLKKNDILGILIDQNVSVAEGVFVDFFGQPACTTTGLALLAATGLSSEKRSSSSERATGTRMSLSTLRISRASSKTPSGSIQTSGSGSTSDGRQP